MLAPKVINEIRIPAGNVDLDGVLMVPKNANGLVIFSHGSGSGRFSPRNNMVAEILRKNYIATLLFDLLTEEEDDIPGKRFDIDLLTDRLIAVTRFAQAYKKTESLPIAFFGASTGAASALSAAAELPGMIKGVVSRGGRADLSWQILDQIKFPVLLIVGEWDREVLEINQKAYQILSGEKALKIIPEATHLFSEPGKLEKVAIISADWFEKHFT